MKRIIKRIALTVIVLGAFWWLLDWIWDYPRPVEGREVAAAAEG